MTPLSSPRGTRDILPEQNKLWQHVIHTCQTVAQQLSFGEITVPTFEEVALFQRSLGEGTDIIDKELFLVRGRHTEEEQYALRPEGTAGIVRAYIQNGLRTSPQPVRLYSVLNLFRYERPQKGRYREHVQFDIEQFGSHDASADAWIILTQWTVLSRLGITDAKLSLNSLGSQDERHVFQQQLIAYFQPFEEQLSEDSKRRLVKNPLRILDSKDSQDQPFLEDAPKLLDCLGDESMLHFQQLQTQLTTWNIPFSLDPLLVRGLDYYSKTCFEWSVPASSGRPLALGGGGRYDGLLPRLGGPDSGAVGGGLGLDRLIDLLEERNTVAPKTVHKLALIDTTAEQGLGRALVPELLQQGITLWADFGRPSLNSQLKAAVREGCTYALFVEEFSLQLKNLADGSQRQIQLEELAGALI